MQSDHFVSWNLFRLIFGRRTFHCLVVSIFCNLLLFIFFKNNGVYKIWKIPIYKTAWSLQQKEKLVFKTKMNSELHLGNKNWNFLWYPSYDQSLFLRELWCGLGLFNFHIMFSTIKNQFWSEMKGFQKQKKTKFYHFFFFSGSETFLCYQVFDC